MSLSYRELWTVLHGLIFGSFFLLAFAGGLAGLYSLRPELVTVEGIRERSRRLARGDITKEQYEEVRQVLQWRLAG